ncbi:MAG: hypothetical protein WBY53_18130 [Acidobacteriaceae bacterium]
MESPQSYRRILPLALFFASVTALAQTTPPSPAVPTAPATPHGEVLFQSHGAPPSTPDDDAPPEPDAVRPAHEPTGPVLTDAQRSSILFTAYDLDARVAPATAHLTMRAQVTLRNIGAQPLARIALQISSRLTWASASLLAPTGVTQLPLVQHIVETDADYTGKCSEAIMDLPAPLAPGATVTLDLVYSGALSPSAARLQRLGASTDQALATDWDEIGNGVPNPSSSSSDQPAEPSSSSPVLVALRGFGNILWYPVASPQLFLGDGAKLFLAIGQQRLTERSATVRLRLAVEYRGVPPVAAYFCGRRQPLAALPDDPTAPAGTGTGIATADFPMQPLGFRQPSLFVVQLPTTPAAPLPMVASTSAETQSSNSSPVSADTEGPDMLSVETADPAALPHLTSSAERIAPLLQQWFGPQPLGPLTILDHPGEPFEDDAFLVAPIDKLASTASSPAFAHSLTHAWIHTGQPWFDEGLAQFASLLWIEQTEGRPAAILALNNLIQPLNIAEIGFDSQQAADAASASVGQPLVSATDELYYRRKAAAVWWMLRGITGDKPLQQALIEWRTQPFASDDPTVQAVAFEKLLEKTSGKDLGWFFADWVLRDRGLPDLSIVDVEPRLLPAGKGHDSGWLVSITVHNDAAPAVDVPLTLLSGTFTTTTRIHIAGFSNATTRVVVASPPTEVILNDGSTPEVRASTHTREVVLQPAAAAF